MFQKTINYRVYTKYYGIVLKKRFLWVFWIKHKLFINKLKVHLYIEETYIKKDNYIRYMRENNYVSKFRNINNTMIYNPIGYNKKQFPIINLIFMK